MISRSSLLVLLMSAVGLIALGLFAPGGATKAVADPSEDRLGCGTFCQNAGGYGGVSAGAAVGVGVGANALIGGLGNSFALQPVSVEGQTGLNAFAGVASLELRQRY